MGGRCPNGAGIQTATRKKRAEVSEWCGYSDSNEEKTCIVVRMVQVFRQQGGKNVQRCPNGAGIQTPTRKNQGALSE